MMALQRYAPRRGELRDRRLGLGFWSASVVAAAVVFMTASAYAIPRMMTRHGHPPFVLRDADRTLLEIKQAVFYAYPAWLARHPTQRCPHGLGPLMRGRGLYRTRDAWGQPMDLRCGGPLPHGARSIWIRSAGPDGVFDTADDIASWQ